MTKASPVRTKIKKILIANRGEIAMRVIRTAREMSIQTVAVHSEIDADALHVQMADESVCIGKNRAKDSYLNMVALMSACEVTGVDAVHPGYGFLSENPEFADIVTRCGLKFIGPSSESMRILGNKVSARKVAQEAKVPLLSGTGVLESVEMAKSHAKEFGYPVLLKASNGGGGRGMRVVRSEKEMEIHYSSARSESQTAFASTDIFLEKFIEKPRHIEIQILGDGNGQVIHLGERECSLQRRYQKIIEEATAPNISSTLREKMGQAACRLAAAVNYEGVGTVECLVDGDQFYFMEMNSRLQVEHPVTEEVLGIDLVRWQLEVASGAPLPLQQDQLEFRGHAIECRINAEDPVTCLPCPGQITRYVAPGGRRVRLDSSAYQGYKVPPFYDSMIAKLITWGETREEARLRMLRALDEFVIEGIKSNIELHQRILRHADFINSACYTRWIEDVLLKK